MPPYFSVITPSFNQGAYLRACLDSVATQGDDDYEQIIIDNCSTDETAEILARYANKPQIKIICEPDNGQSEAINKGFEAARGEIICWLNSDDAYPEKTFQRLREFFSDPKIDVVFGDALQVSYPFSGSEKRQIRPFAKPLDFTKGQLFNKNQANEVNGHQVSYDGKKPERLVASFQDPHDFIRWWSSKVRLHQPAVFFRRSVREKTGLLREDLHYAMDYEYWWRIAAVYDFHYIAEEMAIQHRQPDSKTIKAWHHVLEEREKIFSPFYSLLSDPEKTLKKEKNATLAEHYLLQAYAAIDNKTARFFLQKAFTHSPSKVLRPSSLGLMKKIFL